MKIESPFWKKISQGYWHTIDKGHIRFNSGKTVELISSGRLFQEIDAYLYNRKGTWGIKLYNFTGIFFTNDQGKGELIQPWVLQAKPGKISWVKI